jgi:predicted MFS family arabinose efflux permease
VCASVATVARPRGQLVTAAGTDARALAAALLGVVAGVLPIFLTAAAAEQIQGSFAFSQAMLGLAVAVFHLVGVIGAPGVARVLPRTGVRGALCISAMVAGSASIAIALLARSGAELVGLLVIAGISNALAGPAASALLRTTVAPRRHGLAFGTQQAGAPAGLFLAGLAVPVVAAPFGWRWAFAAVAVIALLAALAAPSAGSPVIRASTPAPARRLPRGSSTRTALPPLLLATASASAVGVATVSFLVVYATHVGLSASAAGFLLGAVSLAAIVGRIAFGLRVDRGQRDPLRVAPFLLLACTVSVMLLATGVLPAVVAGALLMGGLGWTWHGVLTLAVVRQHDEAPVWAVGMFMASVFVGAILGPLLVGTLATQLSFSAAWWCCAALSLIPLRAMAVARRRSRLAHPAPHTSLVRRLPHPGWLLLLLGETAFLIDGMLRRDPMVIAGSLLVVIGVTQLLTRARRA